MDGFGVMIFSNGDRYEGYFRDDKRHGYGKYFWADGKTYEGEHKEGKRTGRGMRTR